MLSQRVKEFLFQNRGIRQTIAKNMFWLTTGQIGSRLFRAIIIIYAARVLGVSGYGVFAYVLGLAGFFTIFADIGVGHILTREVSKKPEEASYYFATSFWIKVFLLFFTGGLIIFIAPHFSKIEAAKALLPLVALLTAFDGVRDLTIAFFRGKEKMQLEALVMGFTNITIAIFGFIILSVSPTPKSLTIAYVLSAGSGTLLGIAVLRNQFSKLLSSFRKNLLRPILSSAWPIALLGVLGAFMLHTDILMLGFFRTPGEVGLYSASQRIVQFLYMLPGILAISLFPALSRFIEHSDYEKAKTLMERGMGAIFLIALPITVGGVILGRNIIHFLYGSEYLAGVLAFQILIISPLIIFPGYLISNYVVAYDKQRKLAPFMALGSLGNIFLNILLIPTFGIVGSAIATTSALLIYNGSVWRLAKKINNFFTLRYLKKITIATIAMGLVTFTLNTIGFHVIINIALSALIYLGVLILLKERTLVEIKSALPIGPQKPA